ANLQRTAVVDPGDQRVLHPLLPDRSADIGERDLDLRATRTDIAVQFFPAALPPLRPEMPGERLDFLLDRGLARLQFFTIDSGRSRQVGPKVLELLAIDQRVPIHKFGSLNRAELRPLAAMLAP